MYISESYTHLVFNCFLLFSTVGVDYVAASVEVQFQTAPGTVCRSFTILEDTEVEPVETFGVRLETSDPAVRLTDIVGSVSINDSTGTRIAVLIKVFLVAER